VTKEKVKNAIFKLSALVGFFIAAHGIDQGNTTQIFQGAFVLIASVATLFRMSSEAKKNQEAMVQSIVDRITNNVASLTNEHMAVLVLKERQLVFKDEYGAYNFDAFDKELGKFYDRVVMPKIYQDLAAIGLLTYEDGRQAHIDAILKSVYDHLKSHPNDDASFSDDPPSDPLEYEAWCADRLTLCGWDARTTKASGDQGGDIIAEKEGRRVVLQCKLYAGSVGNGAVQEVSAARSYYQAEHAVVVSSGTYTTSARQLASTTGVHLLHHDELSNLDSICAAHV
jgi:restriction system protein